MNPPPQPFNIKKVQPCRVKLRMSIKTIQLICNALQMTSFCMIQVSTKMYFRANFIL